MKSQAMIIPSKMLRSLVGVWLALAVVPVSPHHSLAAPKTAVATNDFLNSIGVVSTFPDRGQPLARTIEMVRYCGFRWVRAGIEGLSDEGPTTIQTFLDLHRETGARLNWGLVSGGTDVKKLVETGRVLAEAGALLAFEGNNEPNNWGVTYQGENGGGTEASWMAVAKLQRDLYQAVKSDPMLAKYPVWSISEPGAQRDNVGLQFLTIPPDAQTRMPDGTKYADYANLHNYIYHSHSPYPADNKTWHAADPTAASRVDGLFGNFGVTWGRGFQGYKQLNTLPRVTTETGVAIGGSVTEQMHGLNLMSMYLAQFKRGYAYTSVYLLRDRTDEEGNQSFGFFKPDYSPRKAAIYLHNLTTILADKGTLAKPGQLDFTIADQPETVHELLLQHSDGTFQLIVWDERLSGQDYVTLQFGDTRASVTTYDPTIGVEPVQTLSNVRSLEITLSDHPIVIALSPSMQ
ncbi:glycosyl hydrolase [Mesorhizobium sp. M4B.F.Ca.ET.190.01.1.1]|uniref:glycosyl hydrolase n=1 Tax=unclassified Mesorhizobium TaxID=325217 RepID=UPI000FE4ADE6|nr:MULTISPECIES: glycosyl hydrolase [unclassified Mesorhizobium]RWF63042.1 MAG: glycosyl hydrolase [Mesorhizobium sp.]TGR11938.1 glycosyl hydrolase [Mesorhizobium sp. M4B.F.Ca.ET.200.01.1.1]TGS20255.1 glycosyl hydrolase [Mesorhizobium sp. M4B.F.Ca.ET.190.01.1.1]TGT31673.1 glycosyl hydrolase [Mesorhizobium sp. M4B.F.Ca.ET.172.01.1.1]TIT44306.1 MAG: glycosyl hydrolase [Mesorhizobium sp.]